MFKLYYYLNLVYRLLIIRQLVFILFNKAYNTIKKEVDTIINKNSTLNIIFNKTSNVNRDSILNIIILIRRGIFYYLNIILLLETVSSQLTVKIVYKALIFILRN
jgi:hypothetical protein